MTASTHTPEPDRARQRGQTWLSALAAALGEALDDGDVRAVEQLVHDLRTLGLEDGELSAVMLAAARRQGPLESLGVAVDQRRNAVKAPLFGELTVEPVLALVGGHPIYERAAIAAGREAFDCAAVDVVTAGLADRVRATRIREAAKVFRQARAAPRLAIEFPPVTDALEPIERAIRRGDLARDYVVVACTERSLARFPEQAKALHAAARAIGCPCAVSRFGAVGAGVLRLRGLRLDYLELAPELTARVEVDPDLQSTLHGLCAIASRQGASVVATGVSNAEALVVLAEVGVDGACGPAVAPERRVTAPEGDLTSHLAHGGVQS